jgi:tetratricopeptide (TPR) repeat protein
VADHYERGGARESTGGWWARAAAQAFEVGSLDDALRFGARAIACGLEGAAFGKLAVLLAEARSYSQDDMGASTWAEQARHSFPAGTAEWWRATQVSAIVYLRTGAPEFDALAAQMIELFTPSSELPEQAVAITYTISECLRVMRDDVADRLLALLPQQLPEALAGRPEGCLASARARKAYRTGYLSEALRFARDALKVLRQAGALRDVCDTLDLCGYLLHELGAYAEAEAQLLEAVQLGHRIGSTGDVCYGQLYLGSIYVRQARYSEAERALVAACDGYRKLGDASCEAEALGHLAEVQRARGDVVRARQTVERALQLDSIAIAPTALLLARLSSIALSAGLTAEALTHASNAHELMREHAVTEFLGLICVSHVESLDAAGLRAQARAVLADAARWLEAQATKLDEPALRRSFLEQVPEHAHILRLAQVMAAPGGQA